MKIFIGLAILVVMGVADAKKCYKKGNFNNQNKAEKWVDDYCDCFAEYMDCDDAACITDLWDDEHASGAVIVQDGESMDFTEWNTRMIDAHSFVDTTNSAMNWCVMDSWTASSVCINETINLYLDIEQPFSLDYNVQKFKVVSRVCIDFDGSGDISYKEYKSRSDAINTILTVLEALSSVSSSFTSPMLPETFFGDFFKNTHQGIVVFLGLVVLTMYLSLLAVVYKISKLCVSAGLCSFSSNSGSTAKAYIIDSGAEAEEVGLNQ